MSHLDALLALITSAVADIKTAYAAEGKSVPGLDDPFVPDPVDAQLQRTIDTVVAAATQLVVTVRNPTSSLLDIAYGMYSSAALSVVERLNVAEILREAGPQGLHIRDIGSRANTNPIVLGRCLRLLATRHVFQELSPDVFANNRLSYLLDTGKSVEAITSNFIGKYEGAAGLAAYVGHTTNEGLVSCPHILEHVTNKELAFSVAADQAPFCRAMKTGKPYWEWVEQPGNELYLHRFGAGMHSTRHLYPEDDILTGFDWSSLSPGDVVVDVGGGIGSASLAIAKAFPKLKFIVQDRAKVIEDGRSFFRRELPSALETGTVEFQDHDFFAPQPVKNAAVFVLRRISHDWSDGYMQTILKHLRGSCNGHYPGLIIDTVIPYATPAGRDLTSIESSAFPEAPKPLLANFGLANMFLYDTDMQMLNFLNSQERTVGQFIDMMSPTGWQLGRIYPSASPQLELFPS